jgi:hypothetical protein
MRPAIRFFDRHTRGNRKRAANAGRTHGGRGNNRNRGRVTEQGRGVQKVKPSPANKTDGGKGNLYNLSIAEGEGNVNT